jgi:hypothetical protein
MAKENHDPVASSRREGNMHNQTTGLQEETCWEMEVYKGTMQDPARESVVDDQEILVFDRDEEAVEETSRALGIAVFYSRKSFSLQFLFLDMLKAWSIQSLVAVEKVRDYIFRLEFNSVGEKNRVLDGGLWRHKGDAIIVAHYDGIMCPSEIRIKSLGMWVRFYDLPPAMMREVVAIQLGGLLERYIKMDCRYLGYMRIRVDYPLGKPLMPSLMVKVKGRGEMQTMRRCGSSGKGLFPNGSYAGECQRHRHSAATKD